MSKNIVLKMSTMKNKESCDFVGNNQDLVRKKGEYKNFAFAEK